MHIVGTMTRLTLISLDDTVVFPGMPVTLALDAGSDKYIFLMPRRGNMYAKVGVVAEVTERVQLPGRGFAVSLMGLHRGVPGAAQTDSDGRLKVNVEERPDIVPPPAATRELEREYRAVVEEILELRGRRSSNSVATMDGCVGLYDRLRIRELWRTPPATRRI